ncbi:MAG: FecR domain-containing protein [Colwellia sp.]|nr:FecR domain-containing protein [Colwellia sp.]
MPSPEHNLKVKKNYPSTMGSNVPSNKALKLEAIDLLTQLNTCTFDTLTAKKIELHLLQWQNKSVQHQQAWLAAEEMWQLMADIKPIAATANITADITTDNKNITQKKYWPKYLVPSSIAASLVLALTLSNVFSVNSQTNIAALPQNEIEHVIEKQYRNQWQAQHRVLLPDNSVVHLNFNSAIKISFSDSVRQIELLKGEAFFKVAKNPKRPFIVKTGNSTASALGTEFIVRRQSDNSSLITVTEGVVKVALSPEQQSSKQKTTDCSTTQNSIILTANESVTSSNKKIGKIQKIASNNIGSWHRGVLIFKDTPLQKVLAEIDRYTAYDITANLGYRYKEKITGTFFIKRLDQELSALITSLNLTVVNNKNGELVLGLPRPKLTTYTP